MKSTSTFIITLGLLVITSVTAIRPAYPSPRALGDGSVSVARDIPTVGTHGSNSTPGDTINDYNPNVAIVGPGGTMPNACTDCSYSLNDCYTHCGGGDRGSCNDYCKCEALLRKDCQPKDCKTALGMKSISDDYCPHRSSSAVRREAAEAIDRQIVDESFNQAVSKRIPSVPIEHLDDPAAKKIDLNEPAWVHRDGISPSDPNGTLDESSE